MRHCVTILGGSAYVTILGVCSAGMWGTCSRGDIFAGVVARALSTVAAVCESRTHIPTHPCYER